MDNNLSLTTIILAAAVAITIWYILDHRYAPRNLHNEPPAIPPTIPYIGHLAGLLWHGTRYYEIMSTKYGLPIYTLMMLNIKVYVITSPALVNTVNRNSKTLAFNPFIALLGKRITGHDEATSKIVQHNLNGEEGPGYVIDVHGGTVAALAPGKSLENMTLAMLQEALIYLEAIESPREMELFGWTRSTVTMCSSRAIYGPDNPLDTKSNLEEAFWDFDHDLNLLIADIGSNVLAPKGYRARSELGDAFQKYFENYIPGQTQSSALVLARFRANTQYRITPWNQGRLEVGTLIGILANTVPSIFYMLVHVYLNPTLLDDLRAELQNTSVSNNSEISKTIMILSMREKCPLLHSTFQEVLRLHAKGAGSRFVREDTLLDNQYLLKKGMIIQIPTAVMHLNPTAWGNEANQFHPRRFLKPQAEEQKPKPTDSKPNSTSYRPFGGGASLCPGRHFVTLETLALTACIVLRFDIEPVSGGGWTIPEQKQESLATNVFPPAHDIKVRVKTRRGCEGMGWNVAMA